MCTDSDGYFVFRVWSAHRGRTQCGIASRQTFPHRCELRAAALELQFHLPLGCDLDHVAAARAVVCRDLAPLPCVVPKGKNGAHHARIACTAHAGGGALVGAPLRSAAPVRPETRTRVPSGTITLAGRSWAAAPLSKMKLYLRRGGSRPRPAVREPCAIRR